MKQQTLSATEYRETLKKRPRRASWNISHEHVTGVVQSASFVLSLPPSANKLTFNLPNGGRANTKEYRSWRASSLKELIYQRARPVQTPVSIAITLPLSCNADCDNKIKPTADLLVCAGIIPDDRREFVRSASVNFADREDMLVEIKCVARASA